MAGIVNVTWCLEIKSRSRRVSFRLEWTREFKLRKKWRWQKVIKYSSNSDFKRRKIWTEKNAYQKNTFHHDIIPLWKSNKNKSKGFKSLRKMKYRKLPEAYTSFVRGFRRRACKRRDIYPGGLISGIEKSPWKKVVVALIKI